MRGDLRGPRVVYPSRMMEDKRKEGTYKACETALRGSIMQTARSQYKRSSVFNERGQVQMPGKDSNKSKLNSERSLEQVTLGQ